MISLLEKVLLVGLRLCGCRARSSVDGNPPVEQDRVEVFFVIILVMVLLDGKRFVIRKHFAPFGEDVVVEQKIHRKNDAPIERLAGGLVMEIEQKRFVLRIRQSLILVTKLEWNGRTLHINNTLFETTDGWEREGGLPCIHVQRVTSLLDIETLVFKSVASNGLLILDDEGKVALWEANVVHNHERIVFGAVASLRKKRRNCRRRRSAVATAG